SKVLEGRLDAKTRTLAVLSENPSGASTSIFVSVAETTAASAVLNRIFTLERSVPNPLPVIVTTSPASPLSGHTAVITGPESEGRSSLYSPSLSPQEVVTKDSVR